MQYFSNRKHNSPTSDAFAEIMKVMNHTEIPSSPDTLRVLLAGFASAALNTASESVFFEAYLSYSNVINFAFKLVKQNFPNKTRHIHLCGF